MHHLPTGPLLKLTGTAGAVGGEEIGIDIVDLLERWIADFYGLPVVACPQSKGSAAPTTAPTHLLYRKIGH